MPSTGRSSVFISYARKDGAELAKRLLGDLQREGCEVWLDTREIAGGATWTKEIEQALDHADVVLALLTAGSYASEICRAEQLRALRHQKCVIPVRAQAVGEIVPLHLETRNYHDFTTTYDASFEKLLKDIAGRNGIDLKEEFRETYVTAPPLPANYVERPEALQNLRDLIITDDSRHNIAVTALEGMGGIGKSVLVQALCHDEVIQQAFPDGVIWVTAGKESVYDLVTRMREVGKGLKDDLTRYDNELGCKNQYRTTMRKKAALIVVDDVWDVRDIDPFLVQAPRSRLVFTTRLAEIASAVGAREHPVDVLTEDQSRHLLSNGSGVEVEDLPAEAGELVSECGRLPLALGMVGAMLRDKPLTFWRRVLEHLRNADLEKIRVQFPDYPYSDLLRAIQVSVNALDETARERYQTLAVLLEDMPVHPAIQRTLWQVDAGMAEDTAEHFINLSLAQRERDSIRLHDLQLDYVRAQYADRSVLALIHGAVRLSAHVISKDPFQFASQVVGRLLPHREHGPVREFTAGLADGAPRPWLRPLHPALHPPGTALMRTLEGHSDSVSGVAVSPDGRRAVSASWDNTLKVWDLDSGRELRTLEGHSSYVSGVAVSPDGRRAVSASEDKTLKVWDLDSGIVVAAFTCDASAECCTFAGAHRIVAGDTRGLVYFLYLELERND